MNSPLPDFVQKLRAQLEHEITSMKDKITDIAEETADLEKGIEERRVAIQRLIGAPFTAGRRRANVSEQDVVGAALELGADGAEFTTPDVAAALGCSNQTATKYLRDLGAHVRLVEAGGAGKPSRWKLTP